MPSRRTVLAGLGSIVVGGYALRDNEDVRVAARSTERAVVGIVDWLGGEEWNARDAAESAHVRVNELRASFGREKLSFDEQLYEIAKSYADRMADEEFYGHEDPQGNGFEHRYQQADYQCNAGDFEGAENIFQTHWQETVTDDGDSEYMGTPQTVGVSVAEGWWESIPHRENIILEAWDGEGIGFAKSSDDKVYAVQNFC